MARRMRQPVRPARVEGQLDLDDYAPIGDGRSVAVSGSDGSLDWWGGTAIDDAPVFDRLLGGEGGFELVPRNSFEVTRRYRPDSNILETVFISDQGRVRLTESLNSGLAGRLPWSELARRLDGLEGEMSFRLHLRLASDLQCSTWRRQRRDRHIAHGKDGLTMALVAGGASLMWQIDAAVLEATFAVAAGQRATFGLLLTRDRPLLQVPASAIDGRLEESDAQWRAWSNKLTYSGQYSNRVRRSALALKLLLFSPSGAIAAAATTSLPEVDDGNKNYDYRFAWVRDVAYSIKAFLIAGGHEEAGAAFVWLLDTIRRHGPSLHVCYTLNGETLGASKACELPGYRGARPVRVGNDASGQRQHGIYGDVMDAAWTFVSQGHVLDATSRKTLCNVVEQAVLHWASPDSGVWELHEERHFTISKVACWAALDKAIRMAEDGHLPDDRIEAWRRERDRIADWIEAHAWSEARQAYTMASDGMELDAAMLAAPLFGYPHRERLRSTVAAIARELGRGPWLYRYTGMQQIEGAFIACGFWRVEALIALGDVGAAREAMGDMLAALPEDAATLHEMVDPATGASVGNFPQGLSHLSLILAAASISRACGIPP